MNPWSGRSTSSLAIEANNLWTCLTEVDLFPGLSQEEAHPWPRIGVHLGVHRQYDFRLAERLTPGLVAG
jgi:hypothetical protein